MCKFADNGCQVGRDLDPVVHVVFVAVDGGCVVPVVTSKEIVDAFCFGQR